MDYKRVAEIANSNAVKNFGRTFTGDQVQGYIEQLKLTKTFEANGHLYGLMTVSNEGELGFILDKNYVRLAYKAMTGHLDTLGDELYCYVKKDNPAIINILKKHNFSITREEDNFCVLRRENGKQTDKLA